MVPVPASELLRFVGDRLRVTLSGVDVPQGARAFLRTNLTRAREARNEVVAASGMRMEDALTFAGSSWHDIPLNEDAQHGQGWFIDLPLLEVGHFRAKAYWRDVQQRQYWPDGDDLSITVHPDHLRTSNIIYCAFPRALGEHERVAAPFGSVGAIERLEQLGFSVIPPSGTLRALTRAVPHIFDTLGCRILHLLPIGPVPTTYARMGRFGSPYAQLDLTGIDPALVEFDRRTTAVEQFRELTHAVHARHGLVILDVVLNHTGWASRLLDEHPEWFRRNADGTLHSPGAWGNVWADLVEFELTQPELWDVLADSLLVWCRRGVDGFRCDAGYMVPLPAWQYILAKVRAEFPDSVFLLEGLGGAFEATRSLLSQGGMQWAYSELFQCYEPTTIAHYLDHAIHHGERIGLLAHYSETHDNDRLAKRGATWASMRNALSALSSQSGTFGFTSGVEWLCTEKIDVHDAKPLFWGASPNLVSELKRLTTLLREHPCFFDSVSIQRLSADDAQVLVLSRTSQEGVDYCCVLINLDHEREQVAILAQVVLQQLGAMPCDLLGSTQAERVDIGEDASLTLRPGQSLCLAAHAVPRGLAGADYRAKRAQAAWAYQQLGALLPHWSLGDVAFAELAEFAAEDPEAFLAAANVLRERASAANLLGSLRAVRATLGYRPVVRFTPADARRITLVPPWHWVLVQDALPFEVEVRELVAGKPCVVHLRSVRIGAVHVVALPPEVQAEETEVQLRFECFSEGVSPFDARLRRLAVTPVLPPPARSGLVLLTNGRGAMTRMQADFGTVHSKYDCVLGANLHPDVPCERWVLVKRVRAWVNANGFITALHGPNLTSLSHGSEGCWTFAANAGAGCRVGIVVGVALEPGKNRLRITLSRVALPERNLMETAPVRITLRFDLEDRPMHEDTQLTPEKEAHFNASSHTLEDATGFLFAPAVGRSLRVSTADGVYHAESEFTYGIVHLLEENRGLFARGDTFSPGWFEVPLTLGTSATLLVDAEPVGDLAEQDEVPSVPVLAAESAPDFSSALEHAAQAFVVRRGEGKTVIAGYPWFLDWGRDTLIAARGLLAAGCHADVTKILLTFADLERDGTLPNYLSGAGEGSRETSDAPLFFALACEELRHLQGANVYALRTPRGRTLGEVLLSIADGYLRGTPNGVRVDEASGLVFSPPHFTWMDTNYPAATPREGYPIELGVLFASLLRQVAQVDTSRRAFFEAMLLRTTTSIGAFFRPELGYCADTLHASSGVPASEATPDDHLRPNQLLAVTLGFLTGEPARSVVRAVEKHLLVPGALRSLAPLPVRYPLPVRDAGGGLLNDPLHPYWGRYEGDEDSRRKPAYHNGTAWNFWMPAYCEALVKAYPGDVRAVAAAHSVLGSAARFLGEGALGHLPEVLDGDAPHAERGCDAQAWSVTEALRVHRWLTQLG